MHEHVPVAVIAGVPLESYRRAKWKPVRDGWKVNVVPSQDRSHANLRSIWQRVLAIADKHSEVAAGVHFILFHDKEDERPRYWDRLKRRSFRAVWLSRNLSKQYGSPSFQHKINEVLDFEEQWRQQLAPDSKSPLLLPETAFKAQADVKDTWQRVRNVAGGRDNIQAVDRSIRRFVDAHLTKGDGWLDSRKRLFKRGTPHGRHGLPSWRRQKLGFRLPEGFHFDVSHQRGKPFELTDQDGTALAFNDYTNIDPHGFIRGGT